MFYPTTYPLPSAWRPNFSQRLRAWLTALTPPPATQILLQAGDGYHLAAPLPAAAAGRDAVGAWHGPDRRR